LRRIQAYLRNDANIKRWSPGRDLNSRGVPSRGRPLSRRPAYKAGALAQLPLSDRAELPGPCLCLGVLISFKGLFTAQ